MNKHLKALLMSVGLVLGFTAAVISLPKPKEGEETPIWLEGLALPLFLGGASVKMTEMPKILRVLFSSVINIVIWYFIFLGLFQKTT